MSEPLRCTVTSGGVQAARSYARLSMTAYMSSVRHVKPKRAKSGVKVMRVQGFVLQEVIFGGCTTSMLFSKSWLYFFLRVASTVSIRKLLEKMLVSLAPYPFFPPVTRRSFWSKFVEDSRCPNRSSGTYTPCSSCWTHSMPLPSLYTEISPLCLSMSILMCRSVSSRTLASLALTMSSSRHLYSPGTQDTSLRVNPVLSSFKTYRSSVLASTDPMYVSLSCRMCSFCVSFRYRSSTVFGMARCGVDGHRGEFYECS